MPIYTFGPWRPDLTDTAQLDSAALRLAEATNIVPDIESYQPQVDPTTYTNALSLTCQGAFACTDKNGNVNWLAGTADTLYRISSNTATWSIVGVAGTALSSTDRWSFVRYGNVVYAAAPPITPLRISMTADASFGAVGGGPPQAVHLAVARNFLITAGTADVPQRLQWSALDNPNSWTVDTTTLADFQDLLGPGGNNQGIVVGLGGADAVVFQERAVWRMLYVGLPLIFQIDLVESARGAIAANSIVQSAGYAFYYSDNGFFQFDGTTSTPIGLGKVDDFFLSEVSDLTQVTAVADANRPLVLWSYQSTSAAAPNYILVYNWELQEWSLVEQDCELVWRALSRHSAPFGDPKLACFTTSHAGAVFNGSAKLAKLTTSEYQFNPQGRSLLTKVYPIIETGAPTTSILHRRNVTATVSTETAISMNAQGFSPVRVDDRLMSIRHRIAAGATWTKWRGLKIDPQPTGRR